MCDLFDKLLRKFGFNSTQSQESIVPTSNCIDSEYYNTCIQNKYYGTSDPVSYCRDLACNPSKPPAPNVNLSSKSLKTAPPGYKCDSDGWCCGGGQCHQYLI